jgi:hypothetical protein
MTGQWINYARITKAKNWRNTQNNPVGQELQFRLRRGCDFEVLGTGWSNPDGNEYEDDEENDEAIEKPMY